MSVTFKRYKTKDDRFVSILVQHPELPDRVYSINTDRLSDDDDVDRVKTRIINHTQRRLQRMRNSRRALKRLFGED